MVVTKQKNTQLTNYMIVLIILFSFAILANLLNILITIFAWDFVVAVASVSAGYQVYSLVMTLVSTVLASIFISKLVKKSSDLPLWTHIVFGYYVVLTTINTVYSAVTMPELGLLSIPFALVGIGIALAVWITFYKHLLKHL